VKNVIKFWQSSKNNVKENKYKKLYDGTQCMEHEAQCRSINTNLYLVPHCGAENRVIYGTAFPAP